MTPQPLSRPALLLLAVACGITVANVYFVQPVTPLIASDFHVAAGTAAVTATVTQLGYAVGIYLVVPLSDRFPRRRLISVLLAAVTVCLVLAGAAPSLPVLLGAGALSGVVTVVPQIMIPMAAGLAAAGGGAAVIGTMQAGLLSGILLARTFGGTVGGTLGWRAPYFIAAGLALVLLVGLLRVLPREDAGQHKPYRELLAAPVRLFLTYPDLRRSCLYQAMLFGGFSAAWTSVALLLTGPGYGLGAPAVGALALVGAGSVLFARPTGKLVDRYGTEVVTLTCVLATIVAAAVLLTGIAGGVVGVIGLAIGLLLLDIAVQGNQVANQARAFALAPQARGSINSAYMTCTFVGGSVGSLLGVQLYGRGGWLWVCLLVGAGAVIALVRHTSRARRYAVAAG